MMCTRNCSRDSASSLDNTLSAMQSAFALACAESSTCPAAALFIRTASVMSTLPSRFASPYRETVAGSVSVVAEDYVVTMPGASVPEDAVVVVVAEVSVLVSLESPVTVVVTDSVAEVSVADTVVSVSETVVSVSESVV